MEITEEQLIQEALKAKERAYCPYSNFRVGCSLLTKNNKIYTGCNVENASYGLCVCAERVAICKAVSEGDRQISTIVVSCDTDEPTFPCGMCRQTIIEFCYAGNDTITLENKTILYIFSLYQSYCHRKGSHKTQVFQRLRSYTICFCSQRSQCRSLIGKKMTIKYLQETITPIPQIPFASFELFNLIYNVNLFASIMINYQFLLLIIKVTITNYTSTLLSSSQAKNLIIYFYIISSRLQF